MCPTGAIGCVCAHISMVLFIVALAGTYWIVGNDDIGEMNVTKTETKEYTEMIPIIPSDVVCHKGLWIGNCGQTTFYIFGNFSTKATDYYLTQGFYSFAFISLGVSVIITYFLLCCSCCKTCEVPFCCFACIPLLQMLSAITGTVALILVGMSYMSEDTFPPEYTDLSLGWTYWVAVASVIMVFLTAILSCCAANDERVNDNQKEYEKI